MLFANLFTPSRRQQLSTRHTPQTLRSFYGVWNRNAGVSKQLLQMAKLGHSPIMMVRNISHL